MNLLHDLLSFVFVCELGISDIVPGLCACVLSQTLRAALTLSRGLIHGVRVLRKRRI